MKKILSWRTRTDVAFSIECLLKGLFGNIDLSKIDQYRLYFLDIGFDKFIKIIPLRKSNDLQIIIAEDIPYDKLLKLIAFLKISGYNKVTSKIKYINLTI